MHSPLFCGLLYSLKVPGEKSQLIDCIQMKIVTSHVRGDARSLLSHPLFYKSLQFNFVINTQAYVATRVK